MKQYPLSKFVCAFCQIERNQPLYYVGTLPICQNCRHTEFYNKGIEFCDACRQPIENLVEAVQIIENVFFENSIFSYRRASLQIMCKNCRKKETGILKGGGV